MVPPQVSCHTQEVVQGLQPGETAQGLHQLEQDGTAQGPSHDGRPSDYTTVKKSRWGPRLSLMQGSNVLSTTTMASRTIYLLQIRHLTFRPLRPFRQNLFWQVPIWQVPIWQVRVPTRTSSNSLQRILARKSTRFKWRLCSTSRFLLLLPTLSRCGSVLSPKWSKQPETMKSQRGNCASS